MKLMVVDDQRVIVDGVSSLLHGNDEIEVLEGALDGFEAVELATKNKPDVILMDIGLPKQDGLDTSRILKQKLPEVKILIFTMHVRNDIMHEALNIGIDGFLEKTATREELVLGIKTVNSGKRFFGKSLRNQFEAIENHQGDSTKTLRPLSGREKEIVRLITNEMTTSEIAESLFISPNTVETHRRNILEKLSVRNTAGLVRYALQRGWF